MAIVSISRIQQRRGRKFSGTGLPQLASGELGWAIDSQELYIGNGSVAEGAPHVGNTRLLTELDVPNLKGESANLLGNLDYIYKASGSIQRVEIVAPGTDYTDGTYNNVELEWVTYGDRPISLPTATITVFNGAVVTVNITSIGYGISYGSQFTVPTNALGLDNIRTGFTFTGTVHPGSNIITNITQNIDKFVVGMEIYGTGILNNSVVTEIGSSSVTISNNSNIISDQTVNLNTRSVDFLLRAISVTGPSVPVKYTALRTIQSRLDDRVNTADFGTYGNGIVDDTVSLQNAINQLFLNVPPVITINAVSAPGSYTINTASASYSYVGAEIGGPGIPVDTVILSVIPGISITMDNPSSSTETDPQIFDIILPAAGSLASANPEFRSILEIPPGTYNISNTLYVPSYATIVGAGIDKTILKFNRDRHITGNANYNSFTISTISAAEYMIGAIVSGPSISPGTIVVDVIDSESLILNNVATDDVTNGEFVLTMVQDTAVVKFVNELSRPGSPNSIENTTSLNQPKNIIFKNLSISVLDNVSDGLQLDAVKDSIFENIALSSTWSSGTRTTNYGISMAAVSESVTTTNNLFKNIIINNFGYGVYSDYDIDNNKFVDGTISSGTYGMVFGEFSNPSIVGKEYGARNTLISNLKFSNIIKQAIWIKTGVKNIIDNIILANVGDNDGVLIPQIYSDNFGNIIRNIKSDRWDYYSLPIRSTYVPEFSGKGLYEVDETIALPLIYTLTSRKLFNLPSSVSIEGVQQRSIIHEIEYVYSSTVGEFTRKGIITVIADIANSQIHLSDEYDYVGNEDFLGWLDFTAAFSGGQSAIGIYYTNSLLDDIGIFSFTYKSSIQ
jgi:hypothetical protein